MTRKTFLAVGGETCMAIFWPSAGYKRRIFVSSGFSAEGTSASAVPHRCKGSLIANGYHYKSIVDTKELSLQRSRRWRGSIITKKPQSQTNQHNKGTIFANGTALWMIREMKCRFQCTYRRMLMFYSSRKLLYVCTTLQYPEQGTDSQYLSTALAFLCLWSHWIPYSVAGVLMFRKYKFWLDFNKQRKRVRHRVLCSSCMCL